MAYALDDMDAALVAALKTSTSTFAVADRHDAIKRACEHFLSEVRSAVDMQDFTIVSGVKSIDPTATVSGFVRDDLVGDTGYIGFAEVKLVGYQKVARYHTGASPTGQPTFMGFGADDTLLFDNEADQQYTLSLPIVGRLTSFTSGTSANPSLNVPSADGGRIAALGAKAYLLMGENDEQREVAIAMVEFEKLIERAKGRFPDTRSAVRDRNVKD